MSRPRGRALGRGLEALIPLTPEGGAGAGLGVPQYVSVDQIRPSAGQMRKRFESEPLRELADSIREHGVLQPVLLRRLDAGFELIAGERRWRAARMAGLEVIPAIVRVDTGAEDSLLLGLIENLQRADLDPIEAARGVRRLIEQFGLTHEQAAARLGKHRVAVSQALRLLSGCPALVSATAAGAISAGHARALVGLPTPEAQESGLKVVLARQLSVRQTERWVRGYAPARPPRPARAPAAGSTRDTTGVQEQLSERYGAAVSLTGDRARGSITLRYSCGEELEGLIDVLLA